MAPSGPPPNPVRTNNAATVEAAAAHGGQVYLAATDVMTLGTMAMVADPGGASVGIWQPGDHAGFAVLGEHGTPTWFEVHSPDYRATVAFYEQVFGWQTNVASDSDDLRYTTFGEGDASLAGVMDAAVFLEPGTPGSWTIYFRAEDCDAASARVVELGGTILQPAEDTPYGRLASVADPTGAPFRIMGDNVAGAS